MKKVSVRQEFDVPVEKLLRAREERYKHLDKFPELKNVHVEHEEKNGHILKQTRHISLADSLPAALTPFLPSGALMLVEVSEFNDETNAHTFTVTPGAGLETLFKVEGISHYRGIDESKSERDYEISISSKALFVGIVIEGAIAEVYNNNLEKDRNSILNFLKIMQES